MTHIKKEPLYIIYTLLISLVLCCLLQNASILRDAERIHHTQLRQITLTLFTFIHQSSLGKAVAHLQDKQTQLLINWDAWLQLDTPKMQTEAPTDLELDEPKENSTPFNIKAPTVINNYEQASSLPLGNNAQGIAASQPSSMIHSVQQDSILLIGDSLMGSVAIGLTKAIKQQFKTKNIVNVSKENTGLSYPSYYNWPQHFEEFIKLHHPTLVIAFLGANDPWDIIMGKKVLKLGSDEWKEEYRLRINKIIDLCTQYGIQLIWVEVPAMRREKLNAGILILNELYQTQTEKNKIPYVKTFAHMSTKEGAYTRHLPDEQGKNHAVRTEDGVHFTPQGGLVIGSLVVQTMATLPAYKKPN